MAQLEAPLNWYVARLRAMSAREVAWRARSRVRVSGRPRRLSPPDFEAARWRSFLDELVAPLGEELIDDASRIAAGELSMWGRAVTIDPRRPAWRLDPFAGGRSPDANRDWGHDLKPIWDLHRQQHLLPLAAGAMLAGRADWAEICAAQILDWIAANPIGTRPGWTSSYETSHRLVGWAFIVPLLGDRLSAAERARIAESYALQAGFTAARPSLYSSANNHRLAELVGLLAAATIGCGAERWEATWAELEREVARQTYPDGGSREQAGGYFLYVMEILWLAGLLARAGGRDLGRLPERLTAMLEWLDAVAGEDGEPPPVGDDAEDRFIRVDYFEPRRAPVIAGRVAALLDGAPSLRAKPRPARPRESVVLSESGYAILRGGAVDAPARIVFDCGELGLGSLAAHGHADALSVLLDLGDRPVLRDSGTCSYAPANGRDVFRRTPAHNTVTIDGASQAEALGPHLWGRRFEARLEASVLAADLDYVRASHDGYRALAAAAGHARSVIYLKREGLVVVLDRVSARRPCTAALVWHLPPGATPAVLAGGGVAMTVVATADADPTAGVAPFSARYGSREYGPRWEWAVRGTEVAFATALALDGSGRPELRLDHRSGQTTVELGARGLRLTESWAGASIEVDR